MSFLQKIRAGIGRFMAGRRGADEFSLALLIGGMVLSLLGNLINWPILSLLSIAAYVYCAFRMLSRNLQKRYAENQKFVTTWKRSTSAIRQWWARLRNIRKYKYYRCPQCKSWLRLPRKVGEVTVTCGSCKHQFKKRA